MELYLPLLFFFIALLYSVAGFGGGSSYLAVLALVGLPFLEMKLIALTCNIVVVLNSTILFKRHKLLNIKKTLPIIIFSVPLAYIGGRLALNDLYFAIFLTGILALAGITMFFKPDFYFQKPKNEKSYFEAIVGGIIGFFSGLIGIGGGIFLSPVLNLSGWDTSKSIAATSSFFILVNSIAGLAGILSKSTIDISGSLLISLLLAVFLGGQVGVRLGIQHFSKNRIKQVTGILILIVAARLFFKII